MPYHEGQKDQAEKFGSFRIPHSLAGWLGECRKNCEVDRLRWFLRDAEIFCQRTFGGQAVTTDSERKATFDFVLSARLLASSVGLNLVRADLELVRDKAGGRSRSCAQIARNEAEVAKGTKLKREPQAVCCPPPEGDEVPVGTRQRECSDQVIARDFLGKAGQPSQLSSLRK